jgi:hypothetical protein
VNAYTKYLPLKSALEDLFGRDAWYALKESNHLPTWRKYGQKTLRAVERAIRDTVEICDDQWLSDVTERLARGLEEVKLADSIEDVVGVLAGTMVEVSFLQIGHMPRRKGGDGSPALRKGEWKLDGFRSVVYLQTPEQKNNQFRAAQRKVIGFNEQFDLEAEYRKSKSKLSYKDWCAKR